MKSYLEFSDKGILVGVNNDNLKKKECNWQLDVISVKNMKKWLVTYYWVMAENTEIMLKSWKTKCDRG